MPVHLSQSAVIYLILMLVVIFIGLMIVTKGKILLTGEGAKLSKMFEYGDIKLIGDAEIPEEKIKIECIEDENGYKIKNIVLNSASFEYYGKEDKIEFMIVLDLGNALRVGYDENEEYKIICELKDKKMQCDPPKNIWFYVNDYDQNKIKSREYFHFTIWRAKLMILEHGGHNLNGKKLKELIDKYSPYYLGSFGLGGFTIDQKCRGWSCDKLKENECKTNSNCYWSVSVNIWFGRIMSKCNACPTEENCKKYNTESMCTQCSYPKNNCKWYENYCRTKDYAELDEKCKKCSGKTKCDENTCINTDPKCWFKFDNTCRACYEDAKCEMFAAEDCADASRCGLNCKVENKICVSE
ncbi:MAG: hypothetical protein QXD48_01045 [Candidatus Aenigmatarchaeota archaeon]